MKIYSSPFRGLGGVLFQLILLIGLIPVQTTAQTQSLQQLQLDIEKLAQLKMMLNNMYSGYNILANGYNNIKNQSLDNFNLHKNYLGGLMSISQAVKNDPSVNAIVLMQSQMVSEYNATYKKVIGTGVFNSDELDYFNKGYARIKKQTDQSMADLQLLITPDRLQMNEAERLSAIEKVRADMETQLNGIRSFTKKVNTLSAMRLQLKKDNQNLRNNYGIPK